MRSLSLLMGIAILLAMAALAACRPISPGWAAKARAFMAEEAVKAFWDQGVRLVWNNRTGSRILETGHGESQLHNGILSVTLGIPLPGVGQTVHVRFCYHGD